MNITMLKIFSDLVENSSFSKTAKQNGISQPAISQKIKTIEKLLNTNLIDKTEKTLRLTKEGTIFHKYAQQILIIYETMINEINNNKLNIPQKLKILTSYWIGVHILPKFIQNYFSTFNELDIDINYLDNTNINTNITTAKPDIAILEIPLNEKEFTSKPLFHEEFVIIGLKKNFINQNILKLENLQNYKIIGLNKTHPLRIEIEKLLLEKFYNIKYTIEFNQINLVKQAIKIYNGITFLPKSAIGTTCEDQDFKILHIKDFPLPLTLYLSQKKYQEKNTKAKQFVQLLKPQ